METEVAPVEMLYCPACNLSTPSWRSRCIHCKEVMPRGARGKSEREERPETERAFSEQTSNEAQRTSGAPIFAKVLLKQR